MTVTYRKPTGRKKRTLIVGAGAAGAMIARQLNNEIIIRIYPVAFVDDDPTKQRMQIYGLPVVGKVKDIPEIVEKKQD